jgi:mRNA interferase MazF
VITPIRGRVYTVDIHGIHHFIAVSNDIRNARLQTFLAVRLTTRQKPRLPSIVPLTAADAPLTGKALCDDIIEIYRDEVLAEKGVVSRESMRRVDDGLRAALSL